MKADGDRGMGKKNNRIVENEHLRLCPKCQKWRVANVENFRLRPDGNWRGACRRCERAAASILYHTKKRLVRDGYTAEVRSREMVCEAVHDLADAMRLWV